METANWFLCSPATFRPAWDCKPVYFIHTNAPPLCIDRSENVAKEWMDEEMKALPEPLYRGRNSAATRERGCGRMANRNVKTNPWAVEKCWQDDKILAQSAISLIFLEPWGAVEKRSVQITRSFTRVKKKVLGVLVGSGLFPSVGGGR